MIKISKFLVANCILLMGLAGHSQAGVIHGGSDLIGGGDLTQLESWMGNGDLQLTNIFTKQTGNNALHWHQAVDGKGPTITVMEVIANGRTLRVGGYNPQSWESLPGGNILTPDPADRIAFLFNLDTGLRYDQNRDTTAPNYGRYQTHSQYNTGPGFGVNGTDFHILGLDYGYANLGFSYGDPLRRGKAYDEEFVGTADRFTVGRFETFAIGQQDVPTPGSLVLLIAGLSVIGWVGFRRRKSGIAV